jgi:hypothetical protein
MGAGVPRADEQPDAAPCLSEPLGTSVWLVRLKLAARRILGGLGAGPNRHVSISSCLLATMIGKQ